MNEIATGSDYIQSLHLPAAPSQSSEVKWTSVTDSQMAEQRDKVISITLRQVY